MEVLRHPRGLPSGRALKVLFRLTPVVWGGAAYAAMSGHLYGSLARRACRHPPLSGEVREFSLGHSADAVGVPVESTVRLEGAEGDGPAAAVPDATSVTHQPHTASGSVYPYSD